MNQSASRPSVSSPQDLLTRLQQHLAQDLEQSVAWFTTEMPAHYLSSTSADEQALHLEQIHSLRRAQERRLTLIDDATNGKLLAFGEPSRHGLDDVLALIQGHRDQLIHRVELNTSRDRSLFLYAFAYGHAALPAGVDLAAHRTQILTAVCAQDHACSLTAARFLDAVDQGYLARSSVQRVVRHIRAWTQLGAHDDVRVVVEEMHDGTHTTRLLLAAAGASPWPVLGHVARVLARYRLALARGYLDLVPAAGVNDSGRALIATVYVTTADGQPLHGELLSAVAQDLAAARRPQADVLMARYRDGTFELDQLDALRAAVACAGYLLAPDFPYLDVPEVGNDLIATQPDFARSLVGLIEARFHPTRHTDAATWQDQQQRVASFAANLDSAAGRAVADALLHVVTAMQLTNLYVPGRLGVSFKLDPALLPNARFVHVPFGVLFFHGPHARGFHIRFRASARGGLRVLIPRGPGPYQRARDGLLREVYDLAWAQQLKNKDIPEGGSKCIALVEPGAEADAAVRQVTDSLIDLLLPPAAMPTVIAAHGAAREADLIFLGPDENMTPARIEWVAARALSRGLPHAATLMSSKPGSGINHKEFGVTSEGIFRWLTVVLPLIGIPAEREYTVKITGGPDGDVGGNLLKIIQREHGARARIVAIADGTGAAYDPAGLDWTELLRLVSEAKGIAAFAPAKLSTAPEARVVPATDKAGEAFRNSLHNTVAADVFLPCGGRPYTINDGNWREFLRADGTPNARAMIEGANIFITAAARQNLEDAGLIVIKDSSANKGGVICSSYEVLAGLVLSDAEFIALKPSYVREVVALIGERADSEAQALISAWTRRHRRVRLSDLSQLISEAINRVNALIEGAIAAHLDDPDLIATWQRHLRAHCPPSLVAGFAARLAARIPRAHRIAILSKRLASRMVYGEGLTWCATYLDTATPAQAWDVLSTYLDAETQMHDLAERLRTLLPERDRALLPMLTAGAQRELVRRALGQETGGYEPGGQQP